MATSPSPLRYAGGKSWLAPRVAEWCRCVGARTLVELFAGGASVSGHAVLTGAVEHAVLAEADPGVRALWECLLGPEPQYWELVARFFDLEPSRDAMAAFLRSTDGGRPGEAARTLVRNRSSYGGGLKAGMLGEGDLRSRWNPMTWAVRIAHIRRHRNAFNVQGACSISCIAAHSGDRKAMLFLDPPYTVTRASAGHGLYRHATLDHDSLLAAACAARGTLVLTYDDTPATRALAVRHGLYFEQLPMHDGRGRKRNELLMARDAQ